MTEEELRARLNVLRTEHRDLDAAILALTESARGGAGGDQLQIARFKKRKLALRDQIAPATLNLDNPDPAAEGLDMVRGQARSLPIEYAISNGFGFGGVNASVLFKRWQ